DEPQRIRLKAANFDPLTSEPDIPESLKVFNDNGYFLVQLKGAVQSEWIEELESIGARILNYLPDYAYVVQMDSDTKSAVEQLPFVRWTGYYHPFYKVSPDLRGRSGNIELNVMVFKTGNEEYLFRVIDEIETLNGIITYDGRDDYIIRAKVDASKIDDIASIPEVSWIDEYSEPVALMDNIRIFTGADLLHMNGYDGSGIVGEIKDNGFDQNHQDFVGQIAGIDGFPPTRAHGTSTFGEVFSSGANNAQARGMLPGAQGVMAHWNVGRETSMSNLVNNWGGVFQSNSWYSGIPNGTYSSFSRSNDWAVFDNDITLLYAAGNGGGTQTITQDASAKNIITVGGIRHYDNIDRTDDRHVAGSAGSQGPTEDGRIKPDICGPYENIYTTDVMGAGGYSPGHYTASFGGTSGATPVVAGSSGLVYQMYKANHFGNNPSGALPHASTVKALLIHDAYQYDFSQADRYEMGWGLVDIGNVYTIGPDHFIDDQSVSLRTGEDKSYKIVPFGG
ncbi:MAG: S8 family serine peptidase, partial [Thermoplasmata archaeon]|nr:S8 family serine peptidase [Thermoplasmata archaeon]